MAVHNRPIASLKAAVRRAHQSSWRNSQHHVIERKIYAKAGPIRDPIAYAQAVVRIKEALGEPIGPAKLRSLNGYNLRQRRKPTMPKFNLPD